jgi:hypothetical protein
VNDAVDEPEAEAARAPAAIEELARACVQYVEQTLGVTLDFTPETLSVLDHYLATTRENALGRPELLPLVTRSLGAYFGEVVRRQTPSFWRVAGEDVHDWRLCEKTVWLSFNPIGVAYDALFDGTEHDGPSSELRIAPEERDAVDRRLSALPPMSEAEFYLFVTRYEAIEIATDALSAQMLEGGSAGVKFDESDYDTSGTLGDN